MHVLALIPARGGSKGVPRKNIRMLAGKPLICHTIDAAKQSQKTEAFCVSTEDSEIAAIAEACGARVLNRPLEIAQDDTPMQDVVHHSLRECGHGFDVLLLLQPTCPQRAADDIDGALALLQDAEVESVISVCQVEDHHPGRMYRSEYGRLVPLFPSLLTARRQELPPIFHRNGAIYACRITHFLKTGSLWDERPAAYVMPRDRSLNIDDSFDFKFAEFVFGGG